MFRMRPPLMYFCNAKKDKSPRRAQLPKLCNQNCKISTDEFSVIYHSTAAEILLNEDGATLTMTDLNENPTAPASLFTSFFFTFLHYSSIIIMIVQFFENLEII